jgi:hypothetical protein
MKMLSEISEAKANVLRIESLVTTFTHQRVVSEQIIHLELSGKEIALPVAVVSEGESVRIYHSSWPLTGGHKIRHPLLPAKRLVLPDIVGIYQTALAEGSLDEIVNIFETDGEVREPSGGEFFYRGKIEIRTIYEKMFGNGGGIGLEHCTVTDDGVRCAIEYNVVKWGNTKLPPQCGIAVYERSQNEMGKLKAARIYDDVAPPTESGV